MSEQMKNIELMREYMRLVEAGEKEPWKHFEVYLSNLNQWSPMGNYHWFSMGTYRFRLKQGTININGFEVPEPERIPLPFNSKYFIPNLHDKQLCLHRIWYNTESDAKLLVSGVVHKTKEAAIQHAKALLSFTAKGNERS